ncbi:unnamed protein product [[Candida] boidinii]|uniref:Unnamed protein product n=1 Tax=Candida boidinii TaxID=5477 RepID=A0A9W6SSW6_CANBO|nr:hypothetical protein B5S30_g302 [[Candida] boidinii]GME66651.1 unnamed protein product [[Candida] boidinii]
MTSEEDKKFEESIESTSADKVEESSAENNIEEGQISSLPTMKEEAGSEEKEDDDADDDEEEDDDEDVEEEEEEDDDHNVEDNDEEKDEVKEADVKAEGDENNKITEPDATKASPETNDVGEQESDDNEMKDSSYIDNFTTAILDINDSDLQEDNKPELSNEDFTNELGLADLQGDININNEVTTEPSPTGPSEDLKDAVEDGSKDPAILETETVDNIQEKEYAIDEKSVGNENENSNEISNGDELSQDSTIKTSEVETTEEKKDDETETTNNDNNDVTVEVASSVAKDEEERPEVSETQKSKVEEKETSEKEGEDHAEEEDEEEEEEDEDDDDDDDDEDMKDASDNLNEPTPAQEASAEKENEVAITDDAMDTDEQAAAVPEAITESTENGTKDESMNIEDDATSEKADIALLESKDDESTIIESSVASVLETNNDSVNVGNIEQSKNENESVKQEVEEEKPESVRESASVPEATPVPEDTASSEKVNKSSEVSEEEDEEEEESENTKEDNTDKTKAPEDATVNDDATEKSQTSATDVTSEPSSNTVEIKSEPKDSTEIITESIVADKKVAPSEDVDMLDDSVDKEAAPSIVATTVATASENIESSSTTPQVVNTNLPLKPSNDNQSSQGINTSANDAVKPAEQQSIPLEQEPEIVADLHTISMSALAKQSHTIVLPSYVSWFNMRKIHKIEKESLPEFFNDLNRNKTPQIYAKYRNFMINSYRLNPNEYLSFTSCRRNLVGDAATLLRVHRFLNKWGLINYQVNPETRPAPIEPPYTGDFTVDLDTPRGLFPFESYKPPVELPDLTKVKQLIGSELLSKKSYAHSISNKALKATTGTEESLNDGPAKKKAKVVTSDIDNGWTKESVKKLLEGIKDFKNDWYAIADHVGDKTAEQCIIRFLQLPIEDKFLADNPQELGPLKYVPNLPFSSTDNPVMSTVAFLVSLVDPKVAAAASVRAVKMMDEELTEKLNQDKEERDESKEKTDPLADIKDAGASAMGIIASRAHVFATYEERQMHKYLTDILNKQSKLVDIKLSKLDKLEREYELQRKQIEKSQEDLFIDRMALFKSTNSVASKINSIVELLENKTENNDTSQFSASDVSQLKSLIQDIKKTSMEHPRKSLDMLDFEVEGSSASGKTEDTQLNPISYEAPQLYRYWSG